MIIFLSLSLDIFEYKSESAQQTLVQKVNIVYNFRIF